MHIQQCILDLAAGWEVACTLIFCKLCMCTMHDVRWGDGELCGVPGGTVSGWHGGPGRLSLAHFYRSPTTCVLACMLVYAERLPDCC